MVSGAPRQPHQLAAPLELHQLTEQHLGFVGRIAERFHSRLERLHLTVVIGAPDVDQVLPTAFELAAVVGEVGQKVGGVAVGLHEHAVALVAEVGGPQPRGAVLLVHEPALAEIGEHGRDRAALVQRALREPRVELHADAVEIVAHPLDRTQVAPLARLLDADRVTQLADASDRPSPRGTPRDSRPRAAAHPVPSEQRRGERVELVPGVVQVVLAVHLGALRREQVGERVTHCDPTPATGVDRPGGVDGHELEVDPVPGTNAAVPVLVTLPDDAEQHLVQPGGSEVEVDEPGALDLDPLQVRRSFRLQRDDDLVGDLARWLADGLGELHRDVRGEVAVAGSGRGRQLDATRGHGEARDFERVMQRGEDLVTNHGRSQGRRSRDSGRRIGES